MFSAGPRRETGVALILALVMLFILTILGVAAMTTANLEEKMSGNIQEQTKAFEAAESGINSIMKEAGALNPNGIVTKNYDYLSQKSGKAEVKSTFTQYTPPSRTKEPGKIYSAVNFQSAHFDLQSKGETITSAKTFVYQGLEQIVSKSSE